MATPLLRLRSDQQLVGLFRDGNEDAFRVIHDRYRARLLAYVRQMLAGLHHDAEDVLQDVFVRAYAGLRANCRELSLRAWLYRIAHNRCVDELRRPLPPVLETVELAPSRAGDPVLESEQRESLRRLIVDIGRLPDQQRSALLMRELSGMPYGEIAGVLGLTVPAIKSLLVRARIGLAAALEARDTACHEIREQLAAAHDRGVRPGGLARRHLHDCSGCRGYRSELRSASRKLAALSPAAGPLGALARLFGLGSGGGAAAGGTGGGVAGFGGTATAGGTFLGAVTSHVAAVVAAAVVAAGGAVEVQQTVAAQLSRSAAHHQKRAATVGHATYAEGTTAATVAATVVSPPSSNAPTIAQQTPVPTGHAKRGHHRIRRQRPASTGISSSASAQVSAPSQSSAGATDATSTQTAGASADAGAAPPVCKSTTTAPLGTTTPPVTTSTCSTSATTTSSGGSPASTSPGSSVGSDPPAPNSAPTATPASSTPGSGSPSATDTTVPAQKT